MNANGSNSNQVCEICGGLGLITRDVPIDHPDFGKAFPCVCQADKVKTRKTSQLRTLSNLDAYADKTFRTFQVDYSLLEEKDQDLLDACPNLAPDHNLTEEQRRQINIAAGRALHFSDNPEGWLLLHGSNGTGKTHLAAAIANRRLEHDEPVIFITAADLLDHLRATYRPSSEVDYDERFEQIRNIPLLVLDDLGAEGSTEWAQEKLYQIFHHRHIARLPTVITTIKSPEEFDPRIHSRLIDRELTSSINLIVPDRRQPQTWRELDLSNLDRYRGMMFDTFDLREEEGLPAIEIKRLERAAQIARYFAESPKGWLVLMGEPGSGKTHLAAAIAYECKARGDQTLFVTASELLDHLRATFYPGSAVGYDKRMEEIKRAAVLVLDNLNIDKNLSSWARDKLFDVLTYRFDYDLPTVITTYQTLQDMDTRLKSRVINEAHSTVVAITAPSYPGKASRRAASPRRRG